VSAAPRFNLRRLRANLYAKGCTELPRCERCGRLTALADWHPTEPACRECVTEQGRAFDDMLGDGPFLPEDSDEPR
jgi:hypothetical protein